MKNEKILKIVGIIQCICLMVMLLVASTMDEPHMGQLIVSIILAAVGVVTRVIQKSIEDMEYEEEIANEIRRANRKN